MILKRAGIENKLGFTNYAAGYGDVCRPLPFGLIRQKLYLLNVVAEENQKRFP